MNTLKKLWTKFLSFFGVRGIKSKFEEPTISGTGVAPYKLETINKELKEKNTLVIDEKTKPLVTESTTKTSGTKNNDSTSEK
jgi:hypothetical protein